MIRYIYHAVHTTAAVRTARSEGSAKTQTSQSDNRLIGYGMDITYVALSAPPESPPPTCTAAGSLQEESTCLVVRELPKSLIGWNNCQMDDGRGCGPWAQSLPDD